ncbi:spermidine synthase [Pendulispora albinea]|uniref:Fused MFS/spermidine synthase n=1 Tax=Pendulispora albinea TaxID=2741071 RepID=A0ABZ2LZJ1_9BACT
MMGARQANPVAVPRSGIALLLPMFAIALFMSATLLFCVQPMIGKMLLPLLGGAPAVWVTCMVFFQAALLVGYGYSHLLTHHVKVRGQVLVHSLVLLLPLLFLPLAFSGDETATWDPAATPVWRLMALLAVRVGLPFVVVSTSAPLLQRWFSTIGHPSGKDPYFLYAASNAGSMLALAAYPAVMEPTMRLAEQSSFWRWAYIGFIVLVMACGAVVLKRAPEVAAAEAKAGPAAHEGAAEGDEAEPDRAIGLGDRLRWIGLSFVPSSMLLGVTTYVTTDIAATPLFWVLPLALYLLTFILVFAKRPPISHERSVAVLPFLTTITVLIYIGEFARPAWLFITPHLLLLFFASMVGHGALAKDRPPAKHLTEFFFWISVGGVLGGIFNGIVAPLVFDRVIEYPLAIALACLCRAESLRAPPEERRRDLLVPLALGAITAGLVLALRAWGMPSIKNDISFAIFALAVFVNHTTKKHPLRFALGVGAVLAASYFNYGAIGRTVYVARNFFGVVKVTHDETDKFVQIVHGSTLHGLQFLDPAKRNVATAYYHATGPLGQVIEMYRAHPAASSNAVIGLGAGAISTYARPGETWTYYEIDPIVEIVARDPRYFTFVHDSFPDPSALRIELGDARLKIRNAPDHGYGLLILDAFSSDSVPVHLVTREAMALYLAKLAPGGILAFHVTNRHLDLRPVFASVAHDAGLVLYGRSDLQVSDDLTVSNGKTGSRWLVAARDAETLRAIASDPQWERLEADPARRPWTDDFSNILSVYRW